MQTAASVGGLVLLNASWQTTVHTLQVNRWSNRTRALRSQVLLPTTSSRHSIKGRFSVGGCEYMAVYKRLQSCALGWVAAHEVGVDAEGELGVGVAEGAGSGSCGAGGVAGRRG